MAAEYTDFMDKIVDFKPTDVLIKIVQEKTSQLDKINKELEDVKTEAARFLEVNKNKNNKGVRAGLRKRNIRIEELQDKICKLETSLELSKKDLDERTKESDKENIEPDEYDFMLKYYKYKAKYNILRSKI